VAQVWFLGGSAEDVVEQYTFFNVLLSVSVAMGRGVIPVVMVVERGNFTGAWYWKDLLTRTIAFERQKCAPRQNCLKNASLYSHTLLNVHMSKV
jgi:hypothetical protein